jgi:hypothetical protein
VALPHVLLVGAPESGGPKNAWCGFLNAQLDYFTNLAWYLVVHSTLVECVMIRAVAPLQHLLQSERGRESLLFRVVR